MKLSYLPGDTVSVIDEYKEFKNHFVIRSRIEQDRFGLVNIIEPAESMAHRARFAINSDSNIVFSSRNILLEKYFYGEKV